MEFSLRKDKQHDFKVGKIEWIGNGVEKRLGHHTLQMARDRCRKLHTGVGKERQGKKHCTCVRDESCTPRLRPRLSY